jgi:phospholipid/cholesterol/gamma-HCH transport system substrate-binding protein
MSSPIPRALGATTCAVALLATSACEIGGLQGTSLPGGNAGGDAISIEAEFDDVLALVPQSSVRVGDVPVGDVDSIELDGFSARVRMKIQSDVELPENVVAELRTTSLLGEKFIALEPPTEVAPQGRLEDGDVIPSARSERLAEIEEVFEAFSALLNGGGIGQLNIIVTELSAALDGREEEVRDLFRRLDTFVGALDERKEDIVRALDALDRLSTTLANETDTIELALADLQPGLTVLADQRQELTTLFVGLDELGQTAARVIDRTQENTVATLQALDPLLARLIEVRPEIRSFLAEGALFSRAFRTAAPGEYLNLGVEFLIDPCVTLDGLIRQESPDLQSGLDRVAEAAGPIFAQLGLPSDIVGLCGVALGALAPALELLQPLLDEVIANLPAPGAPIVPSDPGGPGPTLPDLPVRTFDTPANIATQMMEGFL